MLENKIMDYTNWYSKKAKEDDEMWEAEENGAFWSAWEMNQD